MTLSILIPAYNERHFIRETIERVLRAQLPEGMERELIVVDDGSIDGTRDILAKIEGTDAGFVEALMLNHKGEVAECTGDNVFIISDGLIRTPPTESGILEGLTRNAVISLAREAGYEVRETALVRHDIYTAQECFLTGTAAEVIAVVSLDGRTIGNGSPGPITQDLMARFKQLTRE